MKVLLVTPAPPVKSPFSTREKRPPLGVGTLLSLARDRGHEVDFHDNYAQGPGLPRDFYPVEPDVDLVGVHANTICFQDTLAILEGIQFLRERGLWDGEIAVGGPHASVLPETVPDYVDYVVQGEGELALLDILDGKADRGVVRRPRLQDLDWLPFQPWDVFTRLPYDWSCPWMEGVEPVFTMNTSRGCPFNCAFCSVGSIWGRGYTAMSATRVVDEVEHVVNEHGARGIYFREDNFTLDLRRTWQFVQLMIDRELSDVHWACETRVDNLTEDLVAAMAQAGCRAFYLGVESGSQRVLDIVNKRIDVDQVRHVITWGKRHGINCYASLLTGVPGETFADFRATERLMMELQPYAWTYNVFVGIPYSSLYRRALEEGFYEHVDENGLLYPPGYDVRTSFFYGKDSRELVDFEFKERTEFDRDLLRARPWWSFHKLHRECLGALNGLRRRLRCRC